MADKPERRDFLKATLAAGLAAPAAAQVSAGRPRAINPQAKAVMPNGEVLTREQILERLGLDAKTPPDAWLVIVGCGSNAAALGMDRLRQLVRDKKINLQQLDPEVRDQLERSFKFERTPAERPRPQ